MLRPRVIRHLILNHFDAQPVRRIHQFAELRQRAEMFFHAVEIHRAVSVIIRDWLVVIALMFVQPV